MHSTFSTGLAAAAGFTIHAVHGSRVYALGHLNVSKQL